MSDHAQDEGDLSSTPEPRKFPQHPTALGAGADGDADDNDLVRTSIPLKHLTRRSTQARIAVPVNYSSYLCGFLAGVAQAGIFNPYDRALYLAVKEDRRFLSWRNWQSPYSGFVQSIGGRALSGGLYFPLEHYFLQLLASHSATASHWTSSQQHILAGTAAGAANAMVLNPLSAIKYKTWGREVSRGMLSEARGMLRKGGGLRPFGNGLWPTVYRDVVFGGCYTALRFQFQSLVELLQEENPQQQQQQQWLANCLAAAMATIASGPFNYVRNIQYGTSSRESALSTWSILHNLTEDAAAQPTITRRVNLVLTRLRIGWGTARVAFGMSFGHAVYDWLHDSISYIQF
jgi:hypothetical protein